jgi:hypothetical protein
MSTRRTTRANDSGPPDQTGDASGSGTQTNNAASQTNHATNSSQSTATPAPAKPSSQPSKYEVPLLDDNGDDYTNWCKMVSLVLAHRGFWDVVDGTSPAPNPVTQPDAYRDWSERDREAQIQLLLALSCAPHNCNAPSWALVGPMWTEKEGSHKTAAGTEFL